VFGGWVGGGGGGVAVDIFLAVAASFYGLSLVVELTETMRVRESESMSERVRE
jgi:hypothetical protein